MNPPASHREGLIFLNVLRVLDVPEALGMLAPRPLTIYTGQASAFARTASLRHGWRNVPNPSASDPLTIVVTAARCDRPVIQFYNRSCQSPPFATVGVHHGNTHPQKSFIRLSVFQSAGLSHRGDAVVAAGYEIGHPRAAYRGGGDAGAEESHDWGFH